jgi:hypothetical protein
LEINGLSGCLGHLWPYEPFDDVQGHIEARRHTSRRNNASLIDKLPRTLNLDLWKLPLKLIKRSPMGGGSLSIEQTCLGEENGSGTDRGDQFALGGRMGKPQSQPHNLRARIGVFFLALLFTM